MPSYVIPPAGISAASFFVPANIIDPASPPAYLADAIDPTSGELLSIFSGFDPTDAALLYAYQIRENAGAAVRGIGNRFAEIKKVDDKAATSIRYEIERIAKPHLDSHDIEIVGIDAEATGDYGAGAFKYKNLRSGRDQEIR